MSSSEEFRVEVGYTTEVGDEAALLSGDTPITTQDNEDPSEEDFFWDEEESEALRQARKEARSESSVDAMGYYIGQIGKVKELEHAEEVELAKRIEAGLYAAEKIRAADNGEATIQAAALLALRLTVYDGEQAKKEFLEANLPLAISLAKHYVDMEMDLSDLVQEGNLGLIDAVERFDYTRGIPFAVYASEIIRQHITRALSDKARTIRISVYALEEIRKITRTERDLIKRLGAIPTLEELAEETGFTPEKIKELKQHKKPYSLDEPRGEGKDLLGDFIEDPDGGGIGVVDFGLMKDEFWQILATLSEREAKIVDLRYGLTDGQPRTLNEVCEIFGGLSRAYVERIEFVAMRKLRERSEALRSFYFK